MKSERLDDDERSAHDHELDDDEEESLRCLDCNLTFGSKRFLYSHLTRHIQQPILKLDRVQSTNPPLKITLKNRSGSHSFEIVSPVPSPSSSEPGCRFNSLDEVPREDQHVTGESEDFYEVAEDDAGEEHDETYQDEELGGSQDQVDLEPHDPFDELEETGDNTQESVAGSSHSSSHSQEADNERNVNFSPNLAEVIGGAFLADIDSPIPFEAPSSDEQPQESPKEADTAEGSDSTELSNSNSDTDNTAGVSTLANGNHANSPPYGSIPGAEPTPPPEPSPTGAMEYPKIKIKTTGLFKDPEPRGCTITEITDDNPTGDPSLNYYFPGNNNPTPIWTTPSLEDPLKLPDSDNLLSLFSNNDRNNKDMGYSSSSDNEFISLDTFNERNRGGGGAGNGGGAMQLYNPNSAVATSSSIESITGLPMQALAQQVSRLNPSSGQGLHQQNVLINIQQFPTQPQQPYPPQHPQHQPMYPPHYPPPHPGQPPMHQPYPYQPPNPMYPPHYPPAPGYPPQHPPAPHMPPPPPQHQMGQMQPPQMGQQQPGPMGGPGQPPNSMVPSSQGQPMPPPNQMPQPPNGMQGGYRPPMAPRPSPPRGPQPTTRMPGGPRPPMNNRAPGMRPRAPMIRPRGAAVGQPVRSPMRPRMNGPQNMRPGNQASPIKRDPGGAALQAKRRKVDVLTPSDKDDDDCQVICMQPKNTGLPQIESIQGASESVENSIMKLSDSITLSVRNPPPKPVVSPQKSDAKAVANVLASRGITVTASAKPKESPTKQAPGLPTALSLNGAVSIVAKNTANAKPTASDNLPTVDLTEDSPPTNAANSPNKNRPGLPYRCDLCPAQYPNAMGLNKHRQTYHKTTSGMCELGVPLINIKQPGIMQKLTQIGINNYIPLPSAGPEGTYALPIISTKNPGNVAALGATQMLSLGPVRTIPRPGAPNNNVKK